MQELGLIPLVNHDVGRLANSALPDSPVVPEAQPGRLRLRTAGALHRLAERLDHGHGHAPRWTRERTA
ncbi:hypothetical protein ACQP2F_26950 [Actinoplanes sp. CA-030573]|uniref:hypothetical protein n=1 Tax=Actinoplanes sp. CA-030573 TaxID=3239898 RepID=UPI003D8C830D